MHIPTFSLTGCTVAMVMVTVTACYIRMEDLTNRDIIRRNPKCDRTISVYGYVRGAPIKNNSTIHIAGELSLGL